MVLNALRAVERNVRHVPLQRAPVTLHFLRCLASLITKMKGGPMLALPIMFQAFLRQSNLLLRSLKPFDPISDVRVRRQSINLNIKWSKTQQTFGDGRVFTLPAIAGSPPLPPWSRQGGTGVANGLLTPSSHSEMVTQLLSGIGGGRGTGL